jgi:hypothetical protein
LNSLPNIRTDDNKPPHRLTVCRTPTRTLVKLDINAAICDVCYRTPPPLLRFPCPDSENRLRACKSSSTTSGGST